MRSPRLPVPTTVVVIGALAGVFLGACFSDSAVEDGPGETGGCEPGRVNCPCDAGECLGQLICDPGSDTCLAPTCVVGTVGCPCNDDGTCQVGLTCVDGVECSAEASSTSSTGSVDGTTSSDTTGGQQSGTSGDGASSTTDRAEPAVFIFHGWQAPDGNFGAAAGSDVATAIRDHLDAQCEVARARVTDDECTHAEALISISPADTIGALATRAPVLPLRTLEGNELASSLEAAISQGLGDTLANAGVFAPPEFGPQWWSGTMEGGTFQSNLACAGWTTDESGVSGRTGASDELGQAWYSAGQETCNSEQAVLCVCW